MSQGSNANLSGEIFERIVNEIMFKKIKKNYQIKNTQSDEKGNINYCMIYKGNKFICEYVRQVTFNTYFCKIKHLQSDVLHFEKNPDGLFYFPNKDTKIIECKNQNKKGSVSEKLAFGPSLRDMYHTILEIDESKIDMVYVLDEYFNQLQYQYYFDRMDKFDIKHYFGFDFPLNSIGLEDVKLPQTEIDEIASNIISNPDKYVNDDPTLFDDKPLW